MDTILFTLANIKTLDCRLFPENKENLKGKKIENSGNIAFGSNCLEHILSVKIISKFAVDSGEPLIEITEEIQFQIEDNSWKGFVKDNKIIIPKEFLWHIAGLAVSTTRGVLAAKTENTEFSDFYLPLVNMQDVVKEDIVVPNTVTPSK